MAQSDFSKGSIPQIIIHQSLPMIAAQFIQLLYNVVDRIYIGHLPSIGNIALTGIGLTFPFVTIIMAFTNLFGTGGTPLFSIARGANEPEKAKKIMGNVFSMLLFTSVILFLFCYILRTPILYLFGASDTTIVYAESYLKIYLFGTAFAMITTGMNGFITAQGFPRIAMLSTVIGAVINLILDPILIYGMNMGVQGAALATIFSQMVSAIWVLRFLFTNGIIHLELSSMIPDFSLIVNIAALGMTGFMQQATNALVQILCNATLQTYGGDVYVGVMTIINSIRDMGALPISGLTAGSQPVLGYNYGAKRNDRVKEGINFMSLLGVGYTIVFWIIVLLFPKLFIQIFTSDAETIALGIPAFRLYMMGFVFMSLQFVGQSVFVSLGKAKRAVFFSILRKAIIVAPLTVLLPMLGLGVNGVMIAEPISNLIGGGACFITMYFTIYRKL